MTTRDSSQTARWLVALPFALYSVALLAVSSFVPYAPALDDPEWLALGNYVAEHGALDPDGLFRRVPLWQLLLGAGIALLGDRGGVLALQGGCVFVAFLLLAKRAEGGGATPSSVLIVACAVALSPQFLLYSRHAANELFVGVLAMGVLVLLEQAGWRRALLAGALAGCAAMTKLAAVVLVLPALGVARQGRAGFAAFSLGFVALVLPLVGFAVAQLGWPLDDTSTFNLGSLDAQGWAAYADIGARNEAAWSSFEAAWRAGPVAYLGRAGGRAFEWLLRPGSLDLLSWLPAYPPLLVEVADVAVFFGVLVLAVFGTTRASWGVWLLPVALWIACSFPQKTPYSPRVTVLMPLLLLAPSGLDWLRGRR